MGVLRWEGATDIILARKSELLGKTLINTTLFPHLSFRTTTKRYMQIFIFTCVLGEEKESFPLRVYVHEGSIACGRIKSRKSTRAVNEFWIAYDDDNLVRLVYSRTSGYRNRVLRRILLQQPDCSNRTLVWFGYWVEISQCEPLHLIIIKLNVQWFFHTVFCWVFQCHIPLNFQQKHLKTRLKYLIGQKEKSLLLSLFNEGSQERPVKSDSLDEYLPTYYTQKKSWTFFFSSYLTYLYDDFSAEKYVTASVYCVAQIATLAKRRTFSHIRSFRLLQNCESSSLRAENQEHLSRLPTRIAYRLTRETVRILQEHAVSTRETALASTIGRRIMIFTWRVIQLKVESMVSI